MKRLFLTIFCVYAGLLTALAVPAKAGPRKYTQPDGTVITVTITGDEFGQMIFSEDGMLLTYSDGRLEYASFTPEGVPFASGIQADGKRLPESTANRLQTDSQVEAWAGRLVQNRQEIIESRRLNHAPTFPYRQRTARNEADKDNDSILPQDYGKFHTLFPTTGKQNVLVILVEYKDLGFKYGSYDYFDRLLNEEGFSDFGATGSVRDWMLENSGGRFDPHFDVYGPVKLPKMKNYYGADTFSGMDVRAYEMVVDAMQILDDEVDFSIYDGNGDELIDNVFIIYAGPGDVGADAVWPHEAFISEFKSTEYYFDGVKLEQYACACEHTYDAKRQDGMGTFVHEFSHVMGLPDIYGKGIEGMLSFTPKEWSILDSGAYNNDGVTPPNYSCYEKAALGWLEFLPLKEGNIEMPPLPESNVAYALPTERENEFYFFENRQQTGNDEFLPGHGMLVWHVDYNEDAWKAGDINNNEQHQNVDLVEADNIKSEESRDGDSFPGTAEIIGFGFETDPQLASWDGKPTEFEITEIRESEEGIISFKVTATNDTPDSADPVIGMPACPDGKIHDMLGRKITKPSPGHIYIQNGKKQVNVLP